MTLSKKVALLFCTSLIVSCGGGGGGGGGSSNNSPAPITYSYNRIADTGPGSTFDEDAAAVIYRRHTDGVFWSNLTPLPTLDISINASDETVTRLNYVDALGGSQDRPNFSFSYDLTQNEPVNDLYNIFQGYMYWFTFMGVNNDLVDLTQLYWDLLVYGFYAATGSEFLETDYVTPLIAEFDRVGGVNAWDDTSYDEEIIAAVIGDYTATGDMPVSGARTYNAKAVARYHTDAMGFGYNYDPGVEHHMAAEANGSIVVNHGAKTITGSLHLDYVFEGEYEWERLEGRSAGTVELTGAISGNSFSGDVTWGSGDSSDGGFKGHFFGPDGNELGGVIAVRDFVQGEKWHQMVVAFVGS